MEVQEDILEYLPPDKIFRRLLGSSAFASQPAPVTPTASAATCSPQISPLKLFHARAPPLIVFYDLELNQHNGQMARVIQIEAVTRGRNEVFTSLVNPFEHISNAGIAHRITDEDVKEAPCFEKAWENMIKFVQVQALEGQRVFLVAHNGFVCDQPALETEIAFTGSWIPPFWSFVDSLTLIRDKTRRDFLGQHGLANLYLTATLTPLNGHHDAWVDALALKMIWIQYVEHDREIWDAFQDAVTGEYNPEYVRRADKANVRCAD